MNDVASKGSGFVKWGFGLSVAGALAVILSGYGYQWGWWHFGTGFSIIPWGTGAAVLGGIATGIGFFRMDDISTNFKIMGTVSTVLGLAALINIGYWYNEVQQGYPPIHDITTDLQNPPEFVAIEPLRADAPNPANYAGQETAEAQRNFYTNLEPLYTDLNYDQAYNKALETARQMDWTIVAENQREGRIEAYEKLAWFGFIDDVVIRVTETEEGSRIDVRSKSRIGRGDLGVNAQRIKNYLNAYQK
ncbi:DUF1499 domain-containing protein [Gracilimonas mengyeensis]|uniref:Uncharacterized conserved protein, DUF1499 family n=1 Tax=Gracilimonas mengyeensis TaxID=1302730 RepID=A0A521CVU6_9BACT|nr:DUF1499 domain-containing protein [Gracilimonas mengyeensis]SMO63532.1 Uncharacterized conserved protein, DUF1499 family [Gracilimonas mengyeensis]